MNYIEQLYDITHSYTIWRNCAVYDEDDGWFIKEEELYPACLKPRFKNLTLEDWNLLLKKYIEKHPNEVRTEEELLLHPVKNNKHYVPFHDVDGLGRKLTAGFKKKYPSFTADKQLELIKLISSTEYVFYSEKSHGRFILLAIKDFGFGYESEANKNFEKSLAELLCILIKENVINPEKVRKILRN